MKYTTALPQATFKDGYAATKGWAIVYPADPVTGEYLGAPTMEYFMVGVTPSAYSYLDAPKIVEGKAIVRDPETDKWIAVEDHRGEVYWIKATKERVVIPAYGALSDEFTSEEPGPNDKWVEGVGWVVDEAIVNANLAEEKARAQNTVLMKSEMLRAKVSLGDASEEDKATLRELMAYLDAVNSVKVVNGSYTLPKAPAYLNS